MNCETARQAIPASLAGDLGPDETRDLDVHVAGCAQCEATLREERHLRDLLALRRPTEPSDHLLRRCRADLDDALRREAGPSAGRVDAPAPLFWRFRLSPVMAAALVGAGFLAGWTMFGSGAAALRQIAGSAVLGTSAAAQSNVNTLVADPAGDHVRLSYDTLTRRSLEGTSADPEIRRLLVDTLHDSSNAGLRLDAIEALRARAQEPEVREALVRASREDRNVGARLKALDILRGLRERDAEVDAALLDVLQHDDNDGVRVRAIDLLADERDAHALAVFERLARTDPNGYVRLRATAALDDARNASARPR